MVNWILQQVGKLKGNFISDVMKWQTEDEITAIIGGYSERERIYHPWPLFQTFLAQVVCGGSCREAIARGIGAGWLPTGTSPKTSAYCNARGKLDEYDIRELLLKTGGRLARKASEELRWQGHRVRVVDGTSSQAPDTRANQKEYPQPKTQAKGCGFPVLYWAAMMDLGTGGIVDVAEWGEGGHERVGFRSMWGSLRTDDLVLVDGGLCSYADLALLQKRGIFMLGDAGQRKFNVGMGDHTVTLKRPLVLGDWVKKEELPEEQKVRVIRFKVRIPGCRKKTITLVTTLLDHQRYSMRKLIRLYRRRWEMELRLRDIKTTMGLEMLTAKTPEGCLKELWMGLVGYNIIRTVMCDAAQRANIDVGRISFAGTVQRIRSFAQGPFGTLDVAARYRLLLDHLAIDRLPDRPDRVEPRKRKRRPKA
jgi:hypothetical protein